MTTALSTTYTALKASISRKKLLELRNFEKVKLKLYKAKEDKNFLTTCWHYFKHYFIHSTTPPPPTSKRIKQKTTRYLQEFYCYVKSRNIYLRNI